MASDLFRKIRRAIGSETLNQIEHIDEAGARAITDAIFAAGEVVTTDVSAGGVYVGKGSVLRIQAAADTYIAFGDESIGAVSVTTSPGFKHPGGYLLLSATADFIRASAAFTRLEIMHRG